MIKIIYCTLEYNTDKIMLFVTLSGLYIYYTCISPDNIRVFIAGEGHDYWLNYELLGSTSV